MLACHLLQAPPVGTLETPCAFSSGAQQEKWHMILTSAHERHTWGSGAVNMSFLQSRTHLHHGRLLRLPWRRAGQAEWSHGAPPAG